ncbi:MAG: MOSC domain-containing protein [Halofilum sp. (in: g-proteobacteria)]
MGVSLNVDRVWRYPVKSMLGQRAGSIDVARHGVVGDRRYAVREPSGCLGSGKNAGGFRKIDGLFRFRARYAGQGARLTLPDGSEMAADDPRIDERLSTLLGWPVTLERADDGSHLDDSPVHLLTTASLAWLSRELPDVAADERRFRPNILLAADGSEPLEQDWVGRRLYVGADLVLEITAPTERCGMVSLAQDELPRDARVLRHIRNRADLMFGVYAAVIQPGVARVGDSVALG